MAVMAVILFTCDSMRCMTVIFYSVSLRTLAQLVVLLGIPTPGAVFPSPLQVRYISQADPHRLLPEGQRGQPALSAPGAGRQIL
jgi:hypothetical protein